MTNYKKDIQTLYDQIVMHEEIYFRIVDTNEPFESAEEWLQKHGANTETALLVTGKV